MLVSPHRCNVCQGEITEAYNLRAHTIEHTMEGMPPHLTAVLALLFHAPCCSRYVELPVALAGEEVKCPACPADFLSPQVGVVNRRAGDMDEAGVLWFRCSACREPLQCNRQHNGRPSAGLHVICTACHGVIEVPQAGFARLADLPARI
jgi:hypothetical protein